MKKYKVYNVNKEKERELKEVYFVKGAFTCALIIVDALIYFSLVSVLF